MSGGGLRRSQKPTPRLPAGGGRYGEYRRDHQSRTGSLGDQCDGRSSGMGLVESVQREKQASRAPVFKPMSAGVDDAKGLSGISSGLCLLSLRALNTLGLAERSAWRRARSRRECAARVRAWIRVPHLSEGAYSTGPAAALGRLAEHTGPIVATIGESRNRVDDTAVMASWPFTRFRPSGTSWDLKRRAGQNRESGKA